MLEVLTAAGIGLALVLLGLACWRRRRVSTPRPSQKGSPLLRLPASVQLHVAGYLRPDALIALRSCSSSLRSTGEKAAELALEKTLPCLFRYAPTVPGRSRSLVAQLYRVVMPKIVLLGGEGASRLTRIFNPRTGSLHRCAPIPQDCEGLQAVTLGGEVILLSSDPKAGTKAMVYNHAVDKWTHGPTLPRPLLFPALVVYGDALYAVGGYDTEHRVYSSAVYRYEAGAWHRMKTRLSIPRSGCAAVEFRGALFVAGGVTSDGQCTCSVEFFDPNSPEKGFQSAPSMKLKRGLFQLLVCRDQLLAFGSDESGLVERLDDSGLFWRDAFYVKDYSLGSTAAVDGPNVFFFGLDGQTSGENGARWDYFSLSRRRWGSDGQDSSLFLLPKPGFNRGQAVAVPGQVVTW